MSKKVLVIISDGYEDVEAAAPIDMLTRAGIEVTIASLNGGVVRGAWGTKMQSDKRLEEIDDDYHAVVLPGGLENSNSLAESPAVIALIKKMLSEGKLVAAICASPARVLGEAAGILREKEACGYKGFNDRLAACGAIVVDKAVVVDGNIITSVGPATAIVFGLKIVEQLLGRPSAQKIADQWQVEF